jgi:hypothetical protein
MLDHLIVAGDGYLSLREGYRPRSGKMYLIAEGERVVSRLVWRGHTAGIQARRLPAALACNVPEGFARLFILLRFFLLFLFSDLIFLPLVFFLLAFVSHGFSSFRCPSSSRRGEILYIVWSPESVPLYLTILPKVTLAARARHKVPSAIASRLP